MTEKLKKNQINFLKNLIKSGKTNRQCRDLFYNKYKITRSNRTITNFARKHNLNFNVIDENAYTVKEESVLRGLWLVSANWERKSTELNKRSEKSMSKKIKAMKLNNKISEMLKNEISEKIKNGKDLKELSKNYNIDLKYIKEFSETINKETVEFENLKRWEDADVNELFNLIEDAQKKLKNLDSEQNVANIKINTNSKYIAVAFMSDFHLENVNTDVAQLRRDVEIIKNTKDFYMGFGGDLVDNAATGPHSEMIFESVIPTKAARIVSVKLFEKMKNKVLWTIIGCHDLWDKNNADYDLVQHISRKLKVPYLGAGGDINLKINDVEYMIHARHKYRSSSGLNNGTACCKKILTEIDSKFDIISVGHNHFAEIKIEYYLGKTRIFVRNGSYKKQDRYSKILGYTSNDFNIMIPVVILNTKTKEMKIVSGIENASKLLLALNK